MFDWKRDILALNIQIDELLNQGFKPVYSKLYSQITYNNELTNVKSLCNPNSILCVGGVIKFMWFHVVYY